MSIEITLEDLILGIETDHGIPQGRERMALTENYKDIEAVCAYGNAALDLLKRAGLERTPRNVDTVGDNLWKRTRYMLRSLTSFDANVEIVDMNDSRKMSFEEIGKNLRETLTKYNIPLNTPIEYGESLLD